MPPSPEAETGSTPAAPARRTRGRPRQTPHPTASLLLDTAVDLLDEVPADGVTIPLVLERSGVSYGSLYHHFEDISDLVEQAIVVRYTRRIRDSLDDVRTLNDSRDAADFRQRTARLFLAATSPDRRTNRLDRIEAIGATSGRPRLVARIAQAQKAVTDEHAAMLRDFQQRGWMRADIDPTALSVFTQAVILGRVLDDISEDAVDPQVWYRIVMAALDPLYYAD